MHYVFRYVQKYRHHSGFNREHHKREGLRDHLKGKRIFTRDSLFLSQISTLILKKLRWPSASNAIANQTETIPEPTQSIHPFELCRAWVDGNARAKLIVLNWHRNCHFGIWRGVMKFLDHLNSLQQLDELALHWHANGCQCDPYTYRLLKKACLPATNCGEVLKKSCDLAHKTSLLMFDECGHSKQAASKELTTRRRMTHIPIHRAMYSTVCGPYSVAFL